MISWEAIDAAVTNLAADFMFGLVVMGAISVVVVCFFFVGLAIRYAVRRIQRWFVEEVLVPKAHAEHQAFRKH